MPALFPPSSFGRVRVVDHSPDLKIRRAFSSKIVTRGNSLNAKSEEGRRGRPTDICGEERTPDKGSCVELDRLGPLFVLVCRAIILL